MWGQSKEKSTMTSNHIINVHLEVKRRLALLAEFFPAMLCSAGPGPNL